MTNKKVFCLSGQGSQYFHMGKELYKNNHRFKAWMDHCDEIVFSAAGFSFLDIIYHEDNNKAQPFDNILYTNPALVCIEYCLAKVLMEDGVKPDYIVGYSLGEISAAVIAGALPLEKGISLAVEMAQLFLTSGRPAAMMAVIAPAHQLLSLQDQLSSCWVAGRNFAGSIVLSGSNEEIQRLHQTLKAQSIISEILPVRFGFHSPLIEELEYEFKALAGRCYWNTPTIPLISACTSQIILQPDEEYLWQVIRQPVAFQDTIEHLLANGRYDFIDVGPSGTLATFVKYLLPEASGCRTFAMMTPYGRDLKTYQLLKNAMGVETAAVLI